jgi:hypothetical protein
VFLASGTLRWRSAYRLLPPEAFTLKPTRLAPDFTFHDAQAATVPFATPDWFVALADTAAPGQPASCIAGQQRSRSCWKWSGEGKLLRQEWLTLNANEQRRISIESGLITAPFASTSTSHRCDNRLYRRCYRAGSGEAPATASVHRQSSMLRPLLETLARHRQANGKVADAELLATPPRPQFDILTRTAHWPELAAYPARFGW